MALGGAAPLRATSQGKPGKCMTARLLALQDDSEKSMFPSCRSTQQCYGVLTTSAAIVTYFYEGMVYNGVFLGQILPAVGKEPYVVPFLIAFNTSLGLALWSYYSARSSDPGRIPKRWQEFVGSVGELLPIVPPRLEWQAGKATYCHMCGVPRPERAHHCKVCGFCVLRMDHHCPWLSNCVGFKNHKFFILSVAYGLLTSCVAFFTALPELVACFSELIGLNLQDLPEGGKLNMQSPYIWVFMLFGVIALSLLPLLGAMFFAHVCLICKNTTTIEGHFQSTVNPFDQGSTENLAEVFGDFGIDWVLPITPFSPRSDGVSFERSDIQYAPAVRNRLRAKDISPERVWRVRYQIRSPVDEPVVFAERDPHFMAGLMSWFQGAADEEALLEPGGDSHRPNSKVVSL